MLSEAAGYACKGGKGRKREGFLPFSVPWEELSPIDVVRRIISTTERKAGDHSSLLER